MGVEHYSIVGLLFYLLIWLGFGVATGVLASNKGHPGAVWFVIGLFLGVIGLLIVAVMPSAKKTHRINTQRRDPHPYRKTVRKKKKSSMGPIKKRKKKKKKKKVTDDGLEVVTSLDELNLNEDDTYDKAY